VMLEPDIREYFPDSQAVNAALRGLIKLAPQRKACLRHPKTRASGWHQRLSSSSPYDPDRKQDGASAAGCRLAQRLLAVGS
jgi:hypothetical protein